MQKKIIKLKRVRNDFQGGKHRFKLNNIISS